MKTPRFFLPPRFGAFDSGGPITPIDNQPRKLKAFSMTFLVGYDRFGAGWPSSLLPRRTGLKRPAREGVFLPRPVKAAVV
jgi:hypothetical protein